MSEEERPRRSRLEPVGPLVEALLTDLGAPPPATADSLRAQWSSIAGGLAHLTRPASLHHGVLTVEAATPAAAATVRYSTAAMLRGLQDAGIEGVQRIEVRVARRGR